MSDDSPKRVVVTGPRTPVVRRRPGPPAVRSLATQDVVGELLVASLVRTQLGLALRLGGIFAVLLGGLPLVFALVPASRSTRVLGIPLPWLLLGGVVYPLLLTGGWVYVRLADRNERDFVELVERS